MYTHVEVDDNGLSPVSLVFEIQNSFEELNVVPFFPFEFQVRKDKLPWEQCNFSYIQVRVTAIFERISSNNILFVYVHF